MTSEGGGGIGRSSRFVVSNRNPIMIYTKGVCVCVGGWVSDMRN